MADVSTFRQLARARLLTSADILAGRVVGHALANVQLCVFNALLTHRTRLRTHARPSERPL